MASQIILYESPPSPAGYFLSSEALPLEAVEDMIYQSLSSPLQNLRHIQNQHTVHHANAKSNLSQQIPNGQKQNKKNTKQPKAKMKVRIEEKTETMEDLAEKVPVQRLSSRKNNNEVKRASEAKKSDGFIDITELDKTLQQVNSAWLIEKIVEDSIKAGDVVVSSDYFDRR